MHKLSRYGLALGLVLLTVGAIAYGPGMATAAGQVYSRLKVLEDIMQIIDRHYVDDVDVDELFDNATRGVLENLDPHSRYYSAEEYREMQEQYRGDYAGIGVSFEIFDGERYLVPGGDSADPVRFPVSIDDGGSWLSGLFGGGKRIKVAGSGSGLEVWVDATIRVPHGKSLKVEHGVGLVHAEDAEADLDLDCRSCSIEASGIDGRLLADTGSGRVELEEIRGDVTVDTGSGRVSLSVSTSFDKANSPL